MDFGNIFEKMMKLSLSDDEEKVIDVTSKFSQPDISNNGNISIASDCLDVKVKKTSKDFRFKVFISENNTAKDIKITSKDNTINISSNKKNIKGYVQFYIPLIDELIIETGNNDISVKSLLAEKVKITSKKGDVVYSADDVQSALLKSNNGDIIVNISKDTYKLILKSENGDVVKNGVKSSRDAKYTIECYTKNGDILITNQEKNNYKKKEG